MIVVFSLNEDKTLGNHPILYIPTDLREQSLFFMHLFSFLTKLDLDIALRLSNWELHGTTNPLSIKLMKLCPQPTSRSSSK